MVTKITFFALIALTSCSFSVERELVDAKVRWFNATGNVPQIKKIIIVNDPLPCGKLKNSTACTRGGYIAFNEFQMKVEPRRISCVVLHEVCHALVNNGEHVQGGWHVMSIDPQFEHCLIDESDIEFVCKYVKCLWKRPEENE